MLSGSPVVEIGMEPVATDGGPTGAKAWLDAARGPLERVLNSLGQALEIGVFPAYEGQLEGAYVTVETEEFTYKIGLVTSAQGAEALAAAFLGLGDQDPESAQRLSMLDVRDALGELTNMVVGGARAILRPQLQQDLTMGLPLYVIGRLESTSAWGSEKCALLGMMGVSPIVISVLREQTSGEAARRRQVERELRENEERLRVILEATPDAVITVFEDGSVESSNGAATLAFGYSAEELLGMEAASLLEGVERLRLLSPGRFTCRALRKDGSRFTAELTVSPYGWKQRAMRALLVRDVTAEERAQREVEEVNRRMITLSHAAGKAEVAADVLHNVGNVLNSINVSLSMLDEKLRRSKGRHLDQLLKLFSAQGANLSNFLSTTDKGREALDFFMLLVPELADERARDIAEVKSLTTHLENVKRMVATQQDTASALGVTEEVSLAEIVDTSLRYQAGLIGKHRIQVQLQIGPIPRLVTDKSKVQQIVINLLKNACESVAAAASGEPCVTVSSSVTSDRVILAVSDNGLGIEPELIEMIFRHGFTTKADGHGFGLHSCALFARQLGGKLTVSSGGANQGARFELTLPLASIHSVRPSDFDASAMHSAVQAAS